MWSLQASDESYFDKYLVQSYAFECRVLAIENEEMGEADIPGFILTVPTLYCGNFNGNSFVQITASAIRLVDCVTLQCFSEVAMTDDKIIVASANRCQIVIALSGGKLVYYELDSESRSLVEKSTALLDQDVACMSLRPLSRDSSTSKPSEVVAHELLHPRGRSDLLVLGMWTDNSVRLLALPKLEEITRVQLGVNVQVRDVLLVSFGDDHSNISYHSRVDDMETDSTTDVTAKEPSFRDSPIVHKSHLLVGLGDGIVVSYLLNNSSVVELPSLTDRKDIVLGKRPISFSCFVNEGKTLFVFATCDRPIVIHSRSNNDHLAYSATILGEMTNITSFSSDLFRNCLAMSSDSDLVIGTVNDVQKIHITSHPLGESPKRIAHHRQSQCYAGMYSISNLYLFI